MSRLGAYSLLIAASAAVLGQLPAQAQQPPERFVCDLQAVATGERLRLEFIHDRPRGRAMVIGNNGTENAAVWAGADLISFMELVASGAVQTTTIDGSGRAVHSRHTHGRDGFIQSQWIGRCARN